MHDSKPGVPTICSETIKITQNAPVVVSASLKTLWLVGVGHISLEHGKRIECFSRGSG
jgi:hypothetical protein